MRICRTLSISILAALLAVGTLTFADADARSISYDLNIPSEDLTAALQSFAIASHHKLLYKAELTAGKISRALKGHFTAQEAMEALLSGTGLSYEITGSSVVLIKDQASAKTSELRAEGNTPSSPRAVPQSSGGQPILLAQVGQGKTTSDVPVDKADEQRTKDKKTEGLEEIVVTGTNIHHVEPISPMITITGQDMIDQGYSRLDQVFDQLPQNFKSGVSQESAPALQPGKDSINNQSYASGVNLRGLGPGATLVLLNGRRLATTVLGASVDISSIPVSAIDRVEILTDGASAIYGSDAIAGVVNIITKQDYSGLETGVRSTASKGKDADFGGHILGGYDWSGGNFLINFDGEKDGDLLASSRSFMPSTDPRPLDLLPEQIRRTLYAAVRQELTNRLSLASDVLVSDRTFTVQENKANFAGDTAGSAQQLAASVELDFAISRDWTAKVSGQASREKDMDIGFSSAIAPNSPPKSLEQYSYRTNSADAVVDGKLFDLPGGALRAALGGQYKHESMDLTSGRYGQQPISANSSGDRTSEAAYGELYIPIVGKQNAIPFVRELNLDLAERYDHYSDFGSTANPKVALQWVPIESVTLHGAYSKSFRAPLLYELGAGLPQTGYVIPEPNPASPTGTTTTLVLDGSNPKLQAEHSKSYNAGLTFKPTVLPGLKFDVSFFRIDYKDRVDRLLLEGFFGSVFTQAAQLGSIVNTNPTIGQVNTSVAGIAPGSFFDGTNGYCQVGLPGCPFNPASIQAIADLGYVNVGVATVQGYDFDAQYKWQGSFGQIFVDFDGTLLTDNSIQITPTTVSTSLLNQLNEPLRFRAKTNFGWRRSGWAAYGRINFANAYHNSQDPNCPVLPGCSVSSWTTVDSGISYTTPSDNHRLGSGLRLAIDVANLFNREPPYVNRLTAGIPLTYDPLNANPLLRTIGVSITKAW